MRILFTGTGRFGSWQMRGVQMAFQREAWKAVPNASSKDIRSIDVVVIVKHAAPDTIDLLQRWKGPVVYDPLDFWTIVPEFDRMASGILTASQARNLFGEYFRKINPALILCATRAMAEDLAPLGMPADVLYHHFDPRLTIVERNRIERPVVLYHGADTIGLWKFPMHVVSRVSGARFIQSSAALPPPADVLVAVRGGAHANWLSKRWKSNVKAATALRLGLPFVAWPEASYIETHPSALWFQTLSEMRVAIRKALKYPRAVPETEKFSVAWSANELERILSAQLS
ncbi:hypothetical protein M0Q28_06220 [Patescibacteria group bacterium]|jgi:hypothetical protein|nr:hypothetical protein [Patescibacteria group bacterium]